MPLARPDRKKLLILSGLVVFQLMLISAQVPLGEAPNILERAVFFVLSPLGRVAKGTIDTLNRSWFKYVYLRGVETQNRIMRDELFRLRQENLILRNGFSRLDERGSAVRFLSGLHGSFRVAAVIGVDAANIRKSAIINRGQADGLAPQMPVVDGEGRLVGRTIAPLSRHEATVELVTNDNISVGVVSSKTKVLGILSGDSSTGECRLKYILASNEVLEPEEELVTSGFDKIFPPGIPVGRITSMKKEAFLFKLIRVKPYFEYHRLTFVAVLTGERADGF